jgi:hypothetical protein
VRGAGRDQQDQPDAAMSSTEATELGSLIARLQAEVQALCAEVAALRAGRSPRFAAI